MYSWGQLSHWNQKLNGCTLKAETAARSLSSFSAPPPVLEVSVDALWATQKEPGQGETSNGAKASCQKPSQDHAVARTTTITSALHCPLYNVTSPAKNRQLNTIHDMPEETSNRKKQVFSSALSLTQGRLQMRVSWVNLVTYPGNFLG